jgi:hypothetical protein
MGQTIYEEHESLNTRSAARSNRFRNVDHLFQDAVGLFGHYDNVSLEERESENRLFLFFLLTSGEYIRQKCSPIACGIPYKTAPRHVHIH